MPACNDLNSNDPSASTLGEVGPLLPVIAMSAALFALYLVLGQANLTFDGAAFLITYSNPSQPGHLYHLLFGRVLYAFIACGGLIGLSMAASGLVQSAFFFAVDAGLFALLARRVGVGAPVSIAFALLFSFSATSVENATSVELYGASMFAILLSLHALLGVIRRPSPITNLLLSAACTLVLLFHVGYIFWVLAIYIALIFDAEATTRGRLTGALLGVATLACLTGWMALEDQLTIEAWNEGVRFFGEFFVPRSGWALFRRLLEAPVADLLPFAGLLLYPLLVRPPVESTAPPALLKFALIVSFLFFGFYAFWIVDLGSFYLPLMAVWGIFSALAAQSILRDERLWPKPALLAGAGAYFFAFIYGRSPTEASLRFEPAASAPPWPMIALFWILVCSGAWRSYRGTRTTDRGQGEPRNRETIWLVAFGAIALGLNAWAYGPVIAELRKPDEIRLALDAFSNATPSNSRLFTIMPSHRVYVRTGHEALSPGDHQFRSRKAPQLWERHILAGWIRDSGVRGGPALYFDQATYDGRIELWKTPVLADIPLGELSFSPAQTPHGTFYWVRFIREDVGRRHALRRDLYGTENWKGQIVAWTRGEAEWTIHGYTGGAAIIQPIFIGHPDISAEHPVSVEIQIGSGEPAISSFTTGGYKTLRLELDNRGGGPMYAGPLARMTVRPTWVSPEGRTLGVAVYPAQFSQ